MASTDNPDDGGYTLLSTRKAYVTFLEIRSDPASVDQVANDIVKLSYEVRWTALVSSNMTSTNILAAVVTATEARTAALIADISNLGPVTDVMALPIVNGERHQLDGNGNAVKVPHNGWP